MPVYIDLESVKNKLPASLPSSLDDPRINELIEEASEECDDEVGPRYARKYESNTQKFPDEDDTPDTPATIKLCALWLTLSRCYEELGEENRGVEGGRHKPNKIYYRELAEEKLEKIRNGDIDLKVQPQAQGATYEKYPDDESDRKAVFTNTALDAHL